MVTKFCTTYSTDYPEPKIYDFMTTKMTIGRQFQAAGAAEQTSCLLIGIAIF